MSIRFYEELEGDVSFGLRRWRESQVLAAAVGGWRE